MIERAKFNVGVGKERNERNGVGKLHSLVLRQTITDEKNLQRLLFRDVVVNKPTHTIRGDRVISSIRARQTGHGSRIRTGSAFTRADKFRPDVVPGHRIDECRNHGMNHPVVLKSSFGRPRDADFARYDLNRRLTHRRLIPRLFRLDPESQRALGDGSNRRDLRRIVISVKAVTQLSGARPLDRNCVPRSVVDERTARYRKVKFREFRLGGA